MNARKDRRHRIELQRLLDHLARIDRCFGDGAAEHLGILDQTMLAIEEHHYEHLMLESG